MATVKGLTIGIGADAKQFNKEIKGMNKNVRVTQNEVKTLAKSLDIKWDSKRFAAAQRAAQQAIEQTDVKVKALRDRMKHLDDVGTDKQSAHYQKIQNDLVLTEAKAVNMRRELEKIQNLKVENLAKKFDKVGTSIENAGQKLAPFSAAAAGIIAGFAAIGASAINAGDDIGTTAQQLNISTEALQRWRYIADQTDVPITQLENGFKKIQAGLGSLAAGETTDPIAIALEALGVSAEQASKGMSANFEEIIGSLAGMEDATMQAYYANEIFGARMGSQLIPLLNNGGASLAALSEEFATFNVLTDEQVQSLDAFEDVLDKLKFAFTTIKNQIGVALLPLMEQMADTVQNKIIPIFQKFADFFSSLSIKQQKLILGILTLVAALAPMLLIVGKLTKSMGGVIRAANGIKAAFSALAAHPIILVIGIIVALMAILYTTNEEFKASIDGLISSLSGALMPILQTLGSVIQTLLAALMPVVNILLNALAPVLTIVIDTLTMLMGVLTPIINMMLSILLPILESQIEVFGGIIQVVATLAGTLLQLLAPILKFIMGLFGEQMKLFGDLVQMIMNFILPAFTALAKMFTFVANKIQDFLIPVIEKIGGAFASLGEFIPSIINGVVAGVEWMVNQVIGFVNDLIKGINKISKYVGITIDTIDEVDFGDDFGTQIVKTVREQLPVEDTTQEVQVTPTLDFKPTDLDLDAAMGTNFQTLETQLSPVTNVDNSQKDIHVEVTIENYAAEADIDDMVAQFNTKLAEAM